MRINRCYGPAAFRGIRAVHARKLPVEERRFVAPRTGPYLYHNLVHRLSRVIHSASERLELFLDAPIFNARRFDSFGVAERRGIRKLPFDLDFPLLEFFFFHISTVPPDYEQRESQIRNSSPIRNS